MWCSCFNVYETGGLEHIINNAAPLCFIWFPEALTGAGHILFI